MIILNLFLKQICNENIYNKNIKNKSELVIISKVN